MDSLYLVFARIGAIPNIDVRMIGRKSTGWMRGRFRYRNPGEVQTVANEKLYGFIPHYAIDLGFAVPFVFVWALYEINDREVIVIVVKVGHRRGIYRSS